MGNSVAILSYLGRYVGGHLGGNLGHIATSWSCVGVIGGSKYTIVMVVVAGKMFAGNFAAISRHLGSLCGVILGHLRNILILGLPSWFMLVCWEAQIM